MPCFHATVGLAGDPGAMFFSTQVVITVNRSIESAPGPPMQCWTPGAMYKRPFPLASGFERSTAVKKLMLT